MATTTDKPKKTLNDLFQKKYVSKKPKTDYPDRYAAEGILPTDPAQQERVLSKAILKSGIRKKYNLPDDIPDENISKRNFDSPERGKATIEKTHIFSKDGALIPKNYIDDLRKNFGIEYTDKDFENMNKDQLSKFVSDMNRNANMQNKGVRESEKEQTVEKASEFAKGLTGLIKRKVGENKLSSMFGGEKVRPSTNVDFGQIDPITKENIGFGNLGGKYITTRQGKQMFVPNEEELDIKQSNLKPFDAEQNRESLKSIINDPNINTALKNKAIGLEHSLETSKYKQTLNNLANSFGAGILSIPQGLFNTLTYIADPESPLPKLPIFKDTQKSISNMYKEARDYIGDYVSSLSDEHKADSTSEVAQGLGSVVGFTLANIVTRGLGLPATLVAGLTGAFSQAGNSAYDTYKRTGDIDKTYQSFLANIPIGATESVGLGSYMGRLDRMTKGGVKNFVTKIIAETGEEMGQEGFQSYADATVDNWITDANRDPFKESIDNMIVAAKTALIFTGATGGMVRHNKALKEYLYEKGVDEIPESDEELEKLLTKFVEEDSRTLHEYISQNVKNIQENKYSQEESNEKQKSSTLPDDAAGEIQKESKAGKEQGKDIQPDADAEVERKAGITKESDKEGDGLLSVESKEEFQKSKIDPIDRQIAKLDKEYKVANSVEKRKITNAKKKLKSEKNKLLQEKKSLPEVDESKKLDISNKKLEETPVNLPKEKPQSDFSSTQVNIPKKEVKPFIDYAESIPDKDIHVDEDGTKGRETEPHVTALYGLHTENPKEVEKLIKNFGDVEIELGKTSLFENEKYDVLKVEVKSDQLNEINKTLSDNLDYTNDYGDKYQPHVTIAYLKPGKGKKYAGDNRFEGKKIKISELLFSGKDRNKTPIELTAESLPTETKQPVRTDIQKGYKKFNEDLQTGVEDMVEDFDKKLLQSSIEEAANQLEFPNKETKKRFIEQGVKDFGNRDENQTMEEYVDMLKDEWGFEPQDVDDEVLGMPKVKNDEVIHTTTGIDTSVESPNGKNVFGITKDGELVVLDFNHLHQAEGYAKNAYELDHSNGYIYYHEITPEHILKNPKVKVENGKTVLVKKGIMKTPESVSSPKSSQTEKPFKPVAEKEVKSKSKDDEVYVKAKADFDKMIKGSTEQQIQDARNGFGIGAAKFAGRYTDNGKNQKLYKDIYNIYYDYFENLKQSPDPVKKKGKKDKDFVKDHILVVKPKQIETPVKKTVASNFVGENDANEKIFVDEKGKRYVEIGKAADAQRGAVNSTIIRRYQTEESEKRFLTKQELQDSKPKKSTPKKLEDKELDDLWDEFDAKFQKAELNNDGAKFQKVSGDNNNEKILFGSKIINAYVGKELYSIDRILTDVYSKLGEDKFRDNFKFIKGAYASHLMIADDSVTDKMDSLDYVKKLDVDEFINRLEAENNLNLDKPNQDESTRDNTGNDEGDAGTDGTGDSGRDDKGGSTDKPKQRDRTGKGKTGNSKQPSGVLPDTESGTQPDSSDDDVQQSAADVEGFGTTKDNGGNISETSQNNVVEPANAKDSGRLKNYDLRNKEPIRLSKGERKNINKEVKTILGYNYKPEELKESEKETLRQYTGEGGLSSGETKEALTQHYTDYPVIKAMFDALKDAGFKFKNALETAVGSGNFIGMHPEADWTAVDIDKTNTDIVKLLYPKANVYNVPFEDFADTGYDLVISNIPFLEVRGAKGLTIRPDIKALHDFYFLHTLDKVNDNGIIAYVTSKGVMDKVDDSIRREILKKADVIGAFRLPGGTFEKNAHTSVITDIIFLQKRPEGTNKPELIYPENFADDKAFLKSSKTEDDLYLSDYYKLHPENILGEMVVGKNKLYGGKQAYEIRGEADLSKIKINYKPYKTKSTEATTTEEKPLNPERIKDFYELAEKSGLKYEIDYNPAFNDNMVISDDNIQVRDQVLSFRDVNYKIKTYKPLDKTDKNYDKIQRLNQLKKMAEDIQSGNVDFSPDVVQGLINEYKNKYKTHPISDKSLSGLFKSLDEETYHRELSSFFDKDFKPKAVFTKQTRFEGSGLLKIKPDSPLEERALANENNQGVIDLKKAKYLDEADLKDLINKGYSVVSKTKVQNNVLYYSGNIYNKLDDAENLLNDTSIDVLTRAKLQDQVEELERIKPMPKTINDINIDGTEEWLKAYRDRIIQVDVVTDTKSGQTRYESEFGQVYDNYLNNFQLVPLTETIDGRQYPIPQHQIKERLKRAQERVAEVKETIKGRITSHADLLHDVESTYNRKFRSYEKPDYSKAIYLIQEVLDELPKTLKNGNPFALRKNQIEWITKAFYEGRGINGHDVGGGKTFSAIVLARLLKKRGIANKPLFVVPAKTITKWKRDILFAFPDAVVYDLGSLSADKRKQSLFDIANNEADYVLISHEGFANIDLPIDIELEYLDDIVSQSMVNNDLTGRAAQVEQEKVQAYKQVIRGKERDNKLTFDKLGFDSVIVDEAHAYKNIGVNSRLVAFKAGIPFTITGGDDKPARLQSARSYDFRFKAKYVSKRNNGNNIFLLTATPTPNKPMETLTMLRHLNEDILKEYGIDTDVGFADTFMRFGSVVNEQNVKGFENILTTVINAQELRGILDRFVDKLSMEQMPWIKLPEGNIINHYTKPSFDFKMIVEDLRRRFHAAKARTRRGEKADTRIGVYTSGRQAAVDPRLYDSEYAEVRVSTRTANTETDKMQQLIDTVSNGLKANRKGGQLIFLDLAGHVHVERGSLKQNLHQEIKNQLLKKDKKLKPEEIAIISGQEITNPKTGAERKLTGDKLNAAKQELVDLYNEGKIKVMIGTTSSMGEGMDIQVKTTDIHNFDIPYTPGAIKQRLGRGLRYGNENDKVNLHFYFLQGSFDQMSYNIVAKKKGWNEAIWDKDVANEIDTVSEMLGGMPSAEEIEYEMEDDPGRKEMLGMEIKRNALVRDLNSFRDTLLRIKDDIKFENALSDKAEKSLADLLQKRESVNKQLEDETLSESKKLELKDEKNFYAKQIARDRQKIKDHPRIIERLNKDLTEAESNLEFISKEVSQFVDKWIDDEDGTINGEIVIASKLRQNPDWADKILKLQPKIPEGIAYEDLPENMQLLWDRYKDKDITIEEFIEGAEIEGYIVWADWKTNEISAITKINDGPQLQKQQAHISSFVDRINDVMEATSKVQKAFPNIEIVFQDNESIVDTYNKIYPKYKLQKGKGKDIKGFYAQDGKIYINLDTADASTPAHEIAGHVFMAALKKSNPSMYQAGLKIALQDQSLVEEVRAEYPELSGERLQDEILAQAVGTKFDEMFQNMKPSERQTWIDRFKNWFKSVINNFKLRAKKYFEGNAAIIKEIDKLNENSTLDEWTSAISQDILDEKVVDYSTSGDMRRGSGTDFQYAGKKVKSLSKSEIEKAYNDYQEGETNTTFDDMVNNIEEIVKDSDESFPDLENAIDDYRQEQKDDYELYGQRGDMDSAMENMEAAILQVIENNDTVSFQKVKQTETPEFKKWFGDSKVVDENGDPLVVYHGTNKNITAFNAFPGAFGWGIYFTNDPDVASQYAERNDEGGSIYPVYLHISNPYVISHTPSEDSNIHSLTELKVLLLDKETRIDKALKRLGYDGIIIPTKSYGGDTEYMVLNPTQVKSTTGNSGTFDPNNPDIRFQKVSKKPITVYHGSPIAGLTEFKKGTWFTDSKDYANNYADKYKTGEKNPTIYERKLTLDKPLNFTKWQSSEVRDPIEILNELKAKFKVEIPQEIIDKYSDWSDEPVGDFLFEMKDYIEKKYDGIKIKDEGYNTYLPFDEKQLSGTFDNANPDIRFQKVKQSELQKEVNLELKNEYGIESIPDPNEPRKISSIRKIDMTKDSGFTAKQRIVFETLNRFEPFKRYADEVGWQDTMGDPTLDAFNHINKNSIATSWVKGKVLPVIQKDGNIKTYKGTVLDYMNLIKGNEQLFDDFLVARRVVEDHETVKRLTGQISDAREKYTKAFEEYTTLKESNTVGKGKALRKVQAIERTMKNLQERLDNKQQQIENDNFDLKDAKRLVSENKEKFNTPAKIYDNINNRLLDVMENTGLISEERADELRESKDYASFQRLLPDLESFGYTSQNPRTKVKSMKQRTGSDKYEIISPTYNQVKAITEIIGKGLENNIWNKLVKLAEVNPNLAERFYPDPKGDLTFKIDGKEVTYNMPPEIQAVATTLRPKELDIFTSLIIKPASLFTRLTTSANPMFALGNITVDQISALMQTKTGFKPGIDPIKSLIEFIQKSEDFQKYLGSGGKHQTLAAYNEIDPDDLTKKLTHQRKGLAKVANIYDAGLNILEFPSNLSEIVTRFAEFKRAKDQGKTDTEALYLASQVSIPFQLQGNFGGRYGRAFIKSIPYFNAGIQALYKFTRSVKEQPVRVASVIAGVIASSVATILAAYLRASDEQKRLLNNQPVNELARAIFIPSPDGKGLIRIRVPQEIGSITGLIYLWAGSNVLNGNKAELSDYLESLENIFPQQVGISDPGTMIMSWLPAALKPSVEVATNKKTYPELAPIVPEYIKELVEPRMQYTDYTSEVAKLIGDTFNWSPSLIDHWIRGQFGAVGNLVQSPSRWLASNPLYRQEERFVMSGRAYNNFFDEKEQSKIMYEKTKKQKFSQDEVMDIVRTNVMFDRTADILTDLRNILKEKDSLPEDIKQKTFELLTSIKENKSVKENLKGIEELSELTDQLKEASGIDRARTSFKTDEFDEYVDKRLTNENREKMGLAPKYNYTTLLKNTKSALTKAINEGNEIKIRKELLKLETVTKDNKTPPETRDKIKDFLEDEFEDYIDGKINKLDKDVSADKLSDKEAKEKEKYYESVRKMFKSKSKKKAAGK